MSGPLAAVQFLTRIPVRLRRAPALAGAVPWFPAVGALIGALVGGVAAALWQVSTPGVSATVGVLVGVLVTGAFHEDGLADVSDAFAGGTTVERRLEILKDPRHGSYGVAALCGSILIRAVALGSLPGPAAMLWSAIAAHALARGAAVALMGSGVARTTGLGADYARDITRTRALGIAAIGWVIAVVALAARFGLDAHLPVAAGALVGVALVGAGAMSWLARRKIGGITGDVLGAAEQVVECLALVVLASWRFS